MALRHIIPIGCLGALFALAASVPAQCPAPADWFPHKTHGRPDFGPPHLNSPGNPNCGFHMWAWDTFLWLTTPTNDGGVRFLDFPTDRDLFKPGRAPSPLNDALEDALERRTLSLLPRVDKGLIRDDDASAALESAGGPFDHITQAGSRGMLVDQHGRVVYYGVHFDKDFYNFVRDRSLFTIEGYKAADPALSFPSGAIELKSSWRVLQENETEDGFYVVDAEVHPLRCRDGGATCKGRDIVLDTSRVERVRAALVGLHVVGVTEQHGEFLWATFEHADNAPDLPPGMASDSLDPVSGVGHTFYSADTPAKDCNNPHRGEHTLDAATQTLSPVTQVMRSSPFGSGGPQDTANIRALNRSVHDQLRADDPSSVWVNYRLAGNVWFGPGTVFEPGIGSKEMVMLSTGSTSVSNTTMETFTQIGAKRARQNCFACHHTAIFGKNLDVSRSLVDNLIERELLEDLASRPRFVPVAKEALVADEPPRPRSAPKLMSFQDVKDLLDAFVEEADLFIEDAPHAAFWRDTDHESFTTGDIPGVKHKGEPLPILVIGSSATSNIILSLRGEGPLFNPDDGRFGRMPTFGPFMHADDIDAIADWIDSGCPE